MKTEAKTTTHIVLITMGTLLLEEERMRKQAMRKWSRVSCFRRSTHNRGSEYSGGAWLGCCRICRNLGQTDSQSSYFPTLLKWHRASTTMIPRVFVGIFLWADFSLRHSRTGVIRYADLFRPNPLGIEITGIKQSKPPLCVFLWSGDSNGFGSAGATGRCSGDM